MKWTKEYFGDRCNPRIAYVSEGYKIIRTQHKNIWTGRVMSEQTWNIFKDGEKIDYAFSLKEAKNIVSTYINKEV